MTVKPGVLVAIASCAHQYTARPGLDVAVQARVGEHCTVSSTTHGTRRASRLKPVRGPHGATSAKMNSRSHCSAHCVPMRAGARAGLEPVTSTPASTPESATAHVC